MDERGLMKNTYKKIGFYLLALGLAATAAQFLLVMILTMCGISETQLQEGGWMMWLATFVPMYCIAMPLFVLLMKKIPAEEGIQTRMKVKEVILFFFICLPVMYCGNLVGNLLSVMLSGSDVVNPLDAYVMENSIPKILIIVIIGPLMEEWIFRKQIIDRCVQYGKKKAVLLSAIAFSLFHMNMFQLFYAFGLGLIFAYVYVRTRKLIYPVILHMMVNFMGGAVAPWVMGKIDMDALMAFSESGGTAVLSEDLIAGAMLLLAYSLVLLTCSIIGFVLLVIKASRSQFLKTKEVWYGKETYGNAGMVCYMIFCIIIAGASLFMA